MIELWKAGLMEYPDMGLNKPIKYTEKFLEEISDISSIIVTDEHENKDIGALRNCYYDNGVLYAESIEGFELEGKGLSPSFHFEALEDCGDYYIPYKGELLNFGLTDSPRNKIFYNSIKGEEDDMANDNVDKLLAQIEERDKTIGSLKTQLKQKNKDIEGKDTTISNYEEELGSLRESVEGLDDIKAKASKYDEIEVSKREELIEKLSKGNDVIKKTFEDFDIAHLEALDKHNILNDAGKGGTYTGTDVDTQGNKQKKKEDETVYSDEDFKNDLAEIGLENMVDME